MDKKYENKIIASGVVAEIKEKRGYHQINFVTKQMGSSWNVNLKMVYYKKLPDWVKRGSKADIEGYLETVPFVDESGKKYTKQRFVVTEFRKKETQTMDAFGIEGMYTAPFEFKALLSGKITHIKEEDKWIRLTILTTQPMLSMQ